MAEEVEGDDVTAGIHRRDGLRAGINPNEFGFALCGLFLNPRGVRFAIVLATSEVSFFVNDPGDGFIWAVEFTNLVHSHGGGTHEVCPPTVVAVALNAKVFPFS